MIGFGGVVAGVEPASIGALPIGLRAPCGYLSRVFTAKLFPSSPLSFTTPQSQLLFGSRISAGQSHQC
ncbi:hypothetical protein FKK45_21485 [Enterobacter hormaechei]|nr:hypothetical protein [Enterobacter hormaechei]